MIQFLWLYLSRIYAAYGADYQPEDLKKKYGQLVAEQEKKIAQEKSVAYPEADLVAVFIQLLQEAPAKHETQTPLPDLQAWGEQLAVTFRSLSRRQLHAYPNTLKVLKALRTREAMLFCSLMLKRLLQCQKIEFDWLCCFIWTKFIFLRIIRSKNHKQNG